MLILILVSCDFIPIPQTKDVTYTYSDDKKPELKINDTIYLKNTINNQKDTFLLDVFSHSKVNDNVSYDQATFYYTLLNGDSIYTDIKVNFTNITYSAGITFWKNSQFISTSFSKNRTITYGGLNGQTYSSVDVFSKSNSKNTDFIPDTIYFSYKYGILRYEYLDGRVYELVSK